METLALFFLTFSTCCKNSDNSSDLFMTLRSLKLFPSISGEFCDLRSQMMFFPLGQDQGQGQQQLSHVQVSLLREMESRLNTISPSLLEALDSDNNNALIIFLERLGVKQTTPEYIIDHYILPHVSGEQLDGTIVTPENILLWTRFLLRFGTCSDLKGKVPVMTSNHVISRSVSQNIYFPRALGNRFDLEKEFSELNLSILDADFYLGCKQETTEEWREFFISKFGVRDHFIVNSEINSDEEMTDFVSPEIGVILSLTAVSQIKCLLDMLNCNWNDYYCKFLHCEASTLIKLSCFGKMLLTSKWLPTVGAIPNKNVIFTTPEQVYIRSSETESILSHFGQYLDYCDTLCSELLTFLGVRRTVCKEDVVRHLRQWSQQKNFSTSLTHMRNVYVYLCEHLDVNELQTMFRGNDKLVFVPEEVSSGECSWFSILQSPLVWELPSASTISLSISPYIVPLSCLYGSVLQKFFVEFLQVPVRPDCRQLVELLENLLLSVDITSLVQVFVWLAQVSTDNSHLESLHTRACIPVRSGNMMKPRQVLFGDCSWLEKLFADGSCESGLQEVLMDTRMEDTQLQDLLWGLGVRKLSCAVECKLELGDVVDGSEEVLRKLSPLVRYAQLWMHARCLVRPLQMDRLTGLRLLVVDWLQMYWTVPDHPMLLAKQKLTHTYCVARGQLVLSRETVSSSQELCDALAAMLLMRDSEQFSNCGSFDGMTVKRRELRGFLSELSLIPVDDVSALSATLRFHGIDDLSERGLPENTPVWCLPPDNSVLQTSPEDSDPEAEAPEEPVARQLMKELQERRRKRPVPAVRTVSSACWPPLPSTCRGLSLRDEIKRRRLIPPSGDMSVMKPPQQELSFEELCPTGSLRLRHRPSSSVDRDRSGDVFVGRRGEWLVNEYLDGVQHLPHHGKLMKVEWMNKQTESFAPYDFHLTLENGKSLFIEVKSTNLPREDEGQVVEFPISIREVQFCLEHPDSYQIYRVWCTDDLEKSSIGVVKDVAQHLLTSNSKIVLSIKM